MSKNRIRQLEPDALDDEQRRVYDAIIATRGNAHGPFRIWLHSPEMADLAQKFGEYVRYRSRLEPRFTELAILVTARAWDCQTEWSLHESHAVDAGLAPEIVEAVRLSQYPEFEHEDEQSVYDFSAELVYNRFVQERTFSHAVESLGDAGVVDLTGIVGYYSMVAMTLNAFQVPLPPGSKPLLVDCPTFR